MAKTIYFPDGTHEVMIGPQAFENVILTRLGYDAFNWYKEMKEQEADEIATTEQDIIDCEMETERYRFMCIDARDSLDEAINLLINKRLDKQKLLDILRTAREELDRNL